MPIIRIKSVKIYTGQKKIYTDAVRASVTNMRYVSALEIDLDQSEDYLHY